MKADLHVHSTASDGTLTPAELVTHARGQGVDVLAIADHDSVQGLPDAFQAAEEADILLVPAVELSAVVGIHDVHVLGYFIDHTDAQLAGHLRDLREARMRRAQTMIEALADAGYEMSMADIAAIADGGTIGRSHVARALVVAGHASSVRDAFERLIGRDKPFYVSKDVRPPAEVVEMIVSSGGLAVVAHPGVSRIDDIIDELVDAGLGGIEAYHADHTPEQRARYAALAAQRGLLVTGGSDYHGPNAPNPEVGSVDLPKQAVQALLAWGEERH